MFVRFKNPFHEIRLLFIGDCVLYVACVLCYGHCWMENDFLDSFCCWPDWGTPFNFSIADGEQTINFKLVFSVFVVVDGFHFFASSSRCLHAGFSSGVPFHRYLGSFPFDFILLLIVADVTKVNG